MKDYKSLWRESIKDNIRYYRRKGREAHEMGDRVSEEYCKREETKYIDELLNL
jgi:hypothetical protein